VSLGVPDKWDYLTYDQGSNRVYVSHGTEITVVDGRSGEVVGRVSGLKGSHGVAIAAAAGHGYADSAEPASVLVFDLKTLRPVKTLPVAADPDPVVYDPFSRHVFVLAGESRSTTVIDTVDDRVIATVSLGGKPEFATADGAGKLFVNIADTREIVRIDTASNVIDARWAIGDCESPHGLSIDPGTRHLFSSCLNGRLLVVNADDGRVEATLPIGKGTDAAAFDAKRKLIFSSNAEGTLSVIAERDPNAFVPLGNVVTAPGAKTMAIDSDSGRIFLVTADVATTTAAVQEGRPPRFTFVPGTVTLLFLDPVR
jgi:YVTN family beta-propeller protein